MIMQAKMKKIMSLFCMVLLLFSVGCEKFQATDMGDGAPDTATESTEEEEDITSTSSDGSTLRYAIISEPTNLDPQLINSSVSATLGFHIYEGLVKNNKGTVKAAMAESYEVSEDGLTYTFHLRDANWSDGQPVTAQNFIDGIKRLINPSTKSDYAYLAEYIKSGKAVLEGTGELDDLGVEATDDKTVVISLETATPYFLNILCMANFSPIRSDILKNQSGGFSLLPSENVYNGPFVVSAWKRGRKIVLEKNEQYYNKDSIALDRVEIVIVSDTDEAYKLYQNGDVDFVEITDASLLSDESNYITDYDGGVEYIAFNFNNRYLQNRHLRQAIANVLNREDILEESGQEQGEAAARYILPDIDGISKKYGEEKEYEAFSSESNRDDALNYLASALEELGVSEASDIQLDLLVENTEIKKAEGEAIEKQLETILGIKVNLKTSPKAKKIELEANGDFAMTLTTWYPDYDDPLAYLEVWKSTSLYNISLYNNPLVDYKLDEIAEYSDDSSGRQSRIFETEKLLCEEAVMAPIQFSKRIILCSESLSGLVTYYIGANYNYIHAYKK